MEPMKRSEQQTIPADKPMKAIVEEWREVMRRDFLMRCGKAVNTKFYTMLLEDVQRVSAKVAERAETMSGPQRMAYAFGMGVIQASCVSRMTDSLSMLQTISATVGAGELGMLADQIMMVMMYNGMSFLVAADSALGLPDDDLFKSMPAAKEDTKTPPYTDIPYIKEVPGVH